MTVQIDEATASQLFDTEVQIRYQNNMKLKNTIEERHGMRGTTLNIPVSEIIEMTEGNFAPTDIPVTPLDETNRQIVTQDYHVKTVIGGGQATLFSYEKIAVHAEAHAKAGARMDDFIKLNAIFSDPNFNTITVVPKTVGVNTGLNEGKLSQGLGYLESQGVDVTNREISVWAAALLRKSLFDDDRVVNYFYNGARPLENNSLGANGYMGLDIRFLGENGVNRVPSMNIGSGVFEYLIPMVHHDSMVQTYNRDMKTDIVWMPNQDRWELLSILTSGAGIVQYNGIVLLTCDTPAILN